jgi:radical SAM superfamily enzyme YgiQ (UPF0313 family)
MKMTMIFPDFEGLPLKYRAYIAPLGLLTLAANTPDRYDVEFIDERQEAVPEDLDTDIAVISAMTPQAGRAYELADDFRSRGIKVVLGGAHPSLMPGEAMAHADAVLVGEAEGLWEGLIADLEEDRSRGFYICEHKPDLTGLPRPRYDLLKEENYLPIRSIQITRGCPLNCEFCAVPKNFGRQYRIRSVDEVISDLEALPSHVYFVDDNILMKKRNFAELFVRMSAMDKKWTGMAPLHIASDKDYVDLIRRSGCWSIYVDIGPSVSFGLKDDVSSYKGGVERSMDHIKRLQDAGIKVMGSFIFGFDHDDESIFENTLSFIEKSGLVEPEFLILTPYPGTPLHDKLTAKGRIFDDDWSHYNTVHAVFTPEKMTPERLEEGVGFLWKEFYGKMDAVDESLGARDEVESLHRRLLMTIPVLFRHKPHELVVKGVSNLGNGIRPVDIATDDLVEIWLKENPPVIRRIVSDTIRELGYGRHLEE